MKHTLLMNLFVRYYKYKGLLTRNKALMVQEFGLLQESNLGNDSMFGIWDQGTPVR